MAAIKILVAEDNPVHAAKMEMLLDEMGYSLLGVASNAGEFLRLFRATEPDLIILDIELKDGGDGIAIASQVEKIKPTPTIFATSFEDKDTINRALQTDPYAYLIKPVERPSLQAAIELAIFKFGRAKDQKTMPFAHEWSEDLILKDCFFVKAGSKLIKVPHTEILWIAVGEERYCDIVTTNRTYPVRTSMNQLESKLNPNMFVRVHRSHIVNIQQVDGIDESDMVIEVKSKNVPLGAAYKTDLVQRLRLL